VNIEKSNLQNRNKKAGFTLIEMLVAIAVSAIAFSGIYSVYSTMMTTTINESDVVDTQQELRLAVDYLSRDIKMAGFLIPVNKDAIDTGSSSTSLNLQTVTDTYAFAVIDEDVDLAVSKIDCTLSIATPTMLSPFEQDDRVRIIRPVTMSLIGECEDPENDTETCPEDVTFTIKAVDDIDDTIAGSAAGEIDLYDLDNSDELAIRAGDLLFAVDDESNDYPMKINWNLNGTTLERTRDDGSTATIIENVSSLSFDYLDENGSAKTDLTETDDIAAVRITLAAVSDGQLDGSDRERELSTIVYLRNANGNSDE
jgi:prepilin-type N-terminal cleavage/methylation domain-containing protein